MSMLGETIDSGRSTRAVPDSPRPPFLCHVLVQQLCHVLVQQWGERTSKGSLTISSRSPSLTVVHSPSLQ
ncbi:MAG: hypothetical protein EWM73_02046 [Nitrospira sp.]|nr:MAG: hypothetical protein EWM73_02046 [Nitrospira sp.]